jgi:hypothetical protein
MTSANPISLVMAASFSRSSPLARRPHTSPIGNRRHDRLDSEQRSTAQNKWRDRDRQIMPPAHPQAATAPPWRIVASTLVNVIEPTESTASAQRAFCKGFCGSGELVALDDLPRT